MMSEIWEKKGLFALEVTFEKGEQLFQQFKISSPSMVEDLDIDTTNLTEGQHIDVAAFYNNLALGIARFDAPCPLLDEENGSCSVYETRPHICRAYGVGYFSPKTKRFRICEHIPNGLKHQKQMADLSSLQREVGSLAFFTLPTGKTALDRPYPIFYFLHLYYNVQPFFRNLIEEYRNHSAEEIARIRYKRMTSRKGQH